MSATTFSAAETQAATPCAHCGQPLQGDRDGPHDSRAGQGTSRFCCPGCAAAAHSIAAMGLGRYYAERVLDPAARPPRPEAAERWDLARYIASTGPHHELSLAVDGLQCGACVWLIEHALALNPALTAGRVNMTTRRLRLAWNGAASQAETFVAIVERLGYRLIPFNPAALDAAADRTGTRLVRALAVAGFAAANVMLASIAVWAGLVQDMGPATRNLMHWVSALVAMPAIAYAGQPFFGSALAALRQGRTNMDVPIAIGVLLVTVMSLVQTINGAQDAYFDSAVSLIFFLLIGRVLDHFARGRARQAAENLLTLRATDAAILQPDGTLLRQPAETVAPGALVLVAANERISIDGTIERGHALIDTALVTGESLPAQAAPGTKVFAGTLNLGPALTIRSTATGEATLLAECVRLIEAAESRRGRFVVLADRVARRYAPIVHSAALLTFLLWWRGLGAPVEQSLLNACAVLIITCPCALALAVPAVQVIATARLFRDGILLKSATALERLAEVDSIVFDKTGTLTLETPVLRDPESLAALPPDARAALFELVADNPHPISQCLLENLLASGSSATFHVLRENEAEPRAAENAKPEIRETVGYGIALGPWSLGRPGWAGGALREGHPRDDIPDSGAGGHDVELCRDGVVLARFSFLDSIRSNARSEVAALQRAGFALGILSGDRQEKVSALAAELGLPAASALGDLSPQDKAVCIASQEGNATMMLGDGANDSLAFDHALCRGTPVIHRGVLEQKSDFYYLGRGIDGISAMFAVNTIRSRTHTRILVFSVAYNLLAVGLAVAGHMNPLVAAVMMPINSLLTLLIVTTGMRKAFAAAKC